MSRTQTTLPLVLRIRFETVDDELGEEAQAAKTENKTVRLPTKMQ